LNDCPPIQRLPGCPVAALAGPYARYIVTHEL